MDPNADHDRRLFHPTTDNKASIALLRRVRAGDRVHFVHDVDVCDAVPEALLADLDPVPGTCHDDDGGYSSVWYCYCAKKFTNKRGTLSGYRQRTVTGSGGASWHSEISRKEVQGSGGGTFCTLSYGRKPNPSSNSIDRMGWCMVEYDLKQQDDAADADAASNYVLCKVYRSNRAKGKSASSASASTSSSKNAASSKKMAKKRKATGGGEHPEAPPAKLIQQQEEQEPEEVQQEPAYCYQLQPQGVDESDHGVEFLSDFNIEDINFYVHDESMVQGAMPEPDCSYSYYWNLIRPPCRAEYSSVWYCYHAKKYKNTRGDASGHRHRTVAGGGGASWHSEISRKEVQGSGGGTFCTLSYGRKPNPSSNSIDRMGWCMVEYDLKEQGDATNSNYVLCKVYRSSRAKGKMASSASTSSSKNTASSSSRSRKTGKKRKTGECEHPEAPPPKLIQQQQEQEPAAYCCYHLPHGVDESEHGGDFLNDFNVEDINFYVDDGMVQGAMAEPGVQTFGDMLGRAESEHQDFLNMEEFAVELLLRGQQPQPIVQPPQPAGHDGGEFIQMPCGPMVPVVPEAMFEDMLLGLGPDDPETVYGQWSSYAPTSSPLPSSYMPCSSLLQGPNNPLRLPYLMC